MVYISLWLDIICYSVFATSTAWVPTEEVQEGALALPLAKKISNKFIGENFIELPYFY